MALTPFLNVITKWAKNSIKKHQQQKFVGQNNSLNSKHFNLIFCYFFPFHIKNYSKQASDGLVFAFNNNLHIFVYKTINSSLKK